MYCSLWPSNNNLALVGLCPLLWSAAISSVWGYLGPYFRLWIMTLPTYVRTMLADYADCTIAMYVHICTKHECLTYVLLMPMQSIDDIRRWCAFMSNWMYNVISCLRTYVRMSGKNVHNWIYVKRWMYWQRKLIWDVSNITVKWKSDARGQIAWMELHMVSDHLAMQNGTDSTYWASKESGLWKTWW